MVTFRDVIVYAIYRGLILNSDTTTINYAAARYSHLYAFITLLLTSALCRLTRDIENHYWLSRLTLDSVNIA